MLEREPRPVKEFFPYSEPPFGREWSPLEKLRAIQMMVKSVESLILEAEVNSLFLGLLKPREKVILALRNFVVDGKDGEGNYLWAQGHYKKIVDWAIEQGRLPSSIWEEYQKRGRLTLKQIGGIMGCSRERIRQIEEKALLKLRHPRELKRFIDYLEGRREEREQLDKTGEPGQVEEHKIEDLHLSGRIQNILKRKGINMVEQILNPQGALNLELLAGTKMFGYKSLQELVRRLKVWDPSLRLDEVEKIEAKIWLRWQRSSVFSLAFLVTEEKDFGI